MCEIVITNRVHVCDGHPSKRWTNFGWIVRHFFSREDASVQPNLLFETDYLDHLHRLATLLCRATQGAVSYVKKPGVIQDASPFACRSFSFDNRTYWTHAAILCVFRQILAPLLHQERYSFAGCLLWTCVRMKITSVPSSSALCALSPILVFCVTGIFLEEKYPAVAFV